MTIIVFIIAVFIIIQRIKVNAYRRAVLNAAARMTGDVQTVGLLQYIAEWANYKLSRLINKKVR